MTMFSDGMLLGVGAGAAPPAYLDSTSNSGASPNSVTAPSGLASGDLEIAVCIIGETGATWTPPSGWSLVVQKSVTQYSAAVFKKIATGSEPGSYAFTSSINNTSWCSIYAYRGATTVSAEGLTAATLSNADPQVAGSISVVQNRILLAVTHLINSAVTLTSGPSGMTLREQQFSTSSPRGAVFDQIVPATGASGSKSFDISSAVFGTAFLLEIQ